MENIILILLCVVVVIAGLLLRELHAPHRELTELEKATIKMDGLWHLTTKDAATKIVASRMFIGRADKKSSFREKHMGEMVWFYASKDKMNKQVGNLKRGNSYRNTILRVFVEDEDLEKMLVRDNWMFRDKAVVYLGKELHPKAIVVHRTVADTANI